MGGRSAGCPDLGRAMATWKYAIASLVRAAEGAFDANSMRYVVQIQSDTDAYLAQMSEENFPVVAGNNRQVFEALRGWMESQQTQGVSVDLDDASLPNVFRGVLCGTMSCYGV